MFPVNETDGVVHIGIIALYDIPTGGLECAIEVTIGATNGTKAGLCERGYLYTCVVVSKAMHNVLVTVLNAFHIPVFQQDLTINTIQYRE